MRQVDLGHWHYLLWHLPATVLTVVASALALVIARSLVRDKHGPAQRALRWKILGWASLGAAMMSAVAWPYLARASRLTVEADGAWQLRNYLGVPLARIPAAEVRSLRGADLGGLGVGSGQLEITRADGSVVRSVRISRDMLDAAYRTLGYSSGMVQDRYGDRTVVAHRYGGCGPREASARE